MYYEWIIKEKMLTTNNYYKETILFSLKIENYSNGYKYEN